MKKQKNSTIVIALMISVLSTNPVYAWNDTDTHPALTNMAVKHLQLTGWIEPYLQNNLGFKTNVEELLPYNNKQMSILNILMEGSKEEDEWPNKPDPNYARFMHHFHSPIDNMGLSQGGVCWLPSIPLVPKDWRCLQLVGWTREACPPS